MDVTLAYYIVGIGTTLMTWWLYHKMPRTHEGQWVNLAAAALAGVPLGATAAFFAVVVPLCVVFGPLHA